MFAKLLSYEEFCRSIANLVKDLRKQTLANGTIDEGYAYAVVKQCAKNFYVDKIWKVNTSVYLKSLIWVYLSVLMAPSVYKQILWWFSKCIFAGGATSWSFVHCFTTASFNEEIRHKPPWKEVWWFRDGKEMDSNWNEISFTAGCPSVVSIFFYSQDTAFLKEGDKIFQNTVLSNISKLTNFFFRLNIVSFFRNLVYILTNNRFRMRN